MLLLLKEDIHTQVLEALKAIKVMNVESYNIGKPKDTSTKKFSELAVWESQEGGLVMGPAAKYLKTLGIQLELKAL